MKSAAEFCRRNPPASGVGAVAGSLVAYRLGLTHIDPIKHGSFFERFLNPLRESPPDITIAAGVCAAGKIAEPWSDTPPVELRRGVEVWGLPALDGGSKDITDYLDHDSGRLGYRELIRQFRPTTLEDYAVIIALYRPGLLHLGIVDRYLARRFERESWGVSHSALRSPLHETLGLWIYQEQVMKAAMEIAGFSAAGADCFRKAMGRQKPDDLECWRRQFAHGAFGVQDSERIYDEIAYFGGFTFLKAHALAWADLAMRAASRMP